MSAIVILTDAFVSTFVTSEAVDPTTVAILQYGLSNLLAMGAILGVLPLYDSVGVGKAAPIAGVILSVLFICAIIFLESRYHSLTSTESPKASLPSISSPIAILY